ncbi:hypothetical protein G7Z17_g8012 [Cylindrodendrum hubeiense]|uniref:BCS1 N-terminal domain-containing protein n=1 Tax=Cylindrodendrum hubeiense TaxID=595255 RepID=A0A9P5HAE8_9HYPO|nr:hypothetical protein G7Z17_g8012 [Cylindrodendrum hubeiense]
MDSLTRITKLGLPPLFNGQGANYTGNASSPFPPGMMDSFLATAGQASPLMQLFLFIYRQIGVQFGLDPSLLLTLLGVLWGLSKILNQVYGMFQVFNSRYLMCALYVGENDHIYSHLMNFLANQQNIAKDRYLMAQTVWKSAWEEEEEMANALTLLEAGDGDEEGEPKYLNFASQAARSSPRYVPAMGTTGFWHNGTYFRVNRKKESFMNTSGWSAMKDLEEIKISCFGRSIDPIKQLLADAKTMYYLDTRQKTTIYRPRAKESRRDGNLWHQVARRPVRPMRTVVLDSTEKHEILRDVNEYLHPGTPRCLQDISVTEEDLAALFTRLPRRCIVLLEDIDTAGLRREPDDDVEDDPKDDTKEKKDKAKDAKSSKKSKKKSKKETKEESESESSSDSDSSEDESTRKKKKKTRSSRRHPRRGMGGILAGDGISLSGLLNAIDGVASHEGRILIMTTNKPESLDEALIRPGRVDVQVGFKHASSGQAGELFHRMYEAKRTKLIGNASASGSLKASPQPKVESNSTVKETEVLDVTTEELREISQEFGKLIPEGMFSPAEIQGFLLKRKKSPRKALNDASEWIEATIKQKESKSKVVTGLKVSEELSVTARFPSPPQQQQHALLPTPATTTTTQPTMANLQSSTPSGKEPGLRHPSNGKTIYHRPLNRSKTAELSQASFAYLFGEMVTYAQRRVKGIQELEQRLNVQGHPIGLKLLDLLIHREPARAQLRPLTIIALLHFIKQNIWQHLFGRQADRLEKSANPETPDEYMIIDNEPLVNQYISVPKEMSQLNCAAFVAGVVEGVCDGADFPARVTAHTVGEGEMWPGKTVFLVKFRSEVLEREGFLGKS